MQGVGWVTPMGMGSGSRGEACHLGPGSLPPMRSTLFVGEVHKRFGRFDDYTKAGFGAIALALKSAGLDRWQTKRPIGLVVGTRRGCLEADVAYFRTAAFEGGRMASPNLFAYTLPNCMLGEASISFGLTGPAFVVDDAAPGHLSGVLTGLDLLAWRLCDTVVAGWCDVPSELDPRPDDPCGAVFFVMSRSEGPTAWQRDLTVIRWGERPLVDAAQLARAVMAGQGRDPQMRPD